MLDRIGNLTALRRISLSGLILSLALAANTAWPQTAPSPAVQGTPSPAPDAPAQAVPQQAEPPPPPKENSGLLNEIGKLLPALKSPGEVIDDLNARAKDAAKDTTDALSRLTTSSSVTGRMACPVAADGTSDCKAAADKLCQTKGFKEGKSLTTEATEKCSPKIFIPGRKREPGDCRNENFVTRALCQ